MANITKWFGYPIYITKLENFEKLNKKIVTYYTKRYYSNQFSIFTNNGCKTKRTTINR
jgi:hypothetical protein